MAEIWEKVVSIFTNFSVYYLIEIGLLFALICFVVLVLKSNNAKSVIVYYAVFTFFLSLALILIKISNPLFDGTLLMLLPQLFFIIAITALFSTEIKRAIWNKKRIGNFLGGAGSSAGSDAETSIDEIIKAVQNMSKNDVGAIIILSNGNLPNGVLDSGVYLDAAISSQLIESVFFPKTALHDGAMILYKNRIQAAGCFLPLAQEMDLSKELGSRHRAGIGLTETVNVTAIIVSEETGIISIAKGGKIQRYADTSMLRETLKGFYWQDLLD